MIASAAACSVASLYGHSNLDDVARSAASASLATQRVLHAHAENADEGDPSGSELD